MHFNLVEVSRKKEGQASVTLVRRYSSCLPRGYLLCRKKGRHDIRRPTAPVALHHDKQRHLTLRIIFVSAIFVVQVGIPGLAAWGIRIYTVRSWTRDILRLESRIGDFVSNLPCNSA